MNRLLPLMKSAHEEDFVRESSKKKKKKKKQAGLSPSPSPRYEGSNSPFNFADTQMSDPRSFEYPPSDAESTTKRKKAKKYRMRLMGKKKKKKKYSSDDSIHSFDTSGRSSYQPIPPRMIPSSVENHSSFDSNDFPLQPSPQVEARKVGAGTNESNKKIRIKPSHAFSSATYMDEEELYNCMMAPSDEFEFLTSYLNPSTKSTRRSRVSDVVRQHFGSPREDGRIGSLRVEVLGCVGLDRVKPDISVYLVAGDCAFSTDTITGARSPVWPNSSKRACVFPVHHAYAKLFIGVFDLKAKKNSEADTFCGRAVIDVPQLRPNTEYDVTCPIRVSSFIYDRRPRGVVRLRFSLHWFSERAALLSYLKRPRNPLAFSRQAKKFPTIPCGDPKTFRNVAVTVHGQDFPGKYTRASFRATMREFNLYQQNLRFLFKVSILDCILYEKPLMSLYLFSTSMFSVWLNSVRYVPPFITGFILFILMENYLTHCASMSGHLGFRPLTIKELVYALIKGGKTNLSFFKPILVKKRARNQVTTEDGRKADIELVNHREFPFSERFEYHKFSAAEAIAPSQTKKSSSKQKGSDLETARRLSIYVAPVGDEDRSLSDENSEYDSDQGDRDDDGMMEQGDDAYENFNSDSEVDDDDRSETNAEKGGVLGAGKASLTRRIRVGPAQNSDTSGRKLPPQVHLSKVEHMMHKLTKNISVEHVHFPPPHLQMQLGKEINAKGPASDVITAKEKQNFDDFDKLLGFRTKNPNPILRITSSFLGPLMRMIRILIYATRISFNLSSWRDPYLTFWVFAFFSVLTFILLIFPWRSFFLVSTLILLGPQNIAIRKYLERRTKEKEEEDRAEREREKLLAAAELRRSLENVSSQSLQPSPEAMPEKKTKKSFWRKNSKEDFDDEDEINEAELYQSPRPAFCANARGTKRTQIPRDVAVPYFRFRKDRFYDWPPDPTVSRATPLQPLMSTTKGKQRGYSEFDFDFTEPNPYEDRILPVSKPISNLRKRLNRQKSYEEEEDYGYGY